VIVSSVSYDTATNTATFALNNIVPDGRYRATLGGSGVADAAGNTLTTDATLDFAFLAGDANRDGTVNLSDFNILASNFGQSPRDFTQGDFSYDGSVDLVDFNLLAGRFGTSVVQVRFGEPSIDGRWSGRLRASEALRELLPD
jgi:hypothetical protein